MDRAVLGAFAAADTFIGINACQRICYRNGTVFAHLYTLAASDTTDLTRGTRDRALIVAGATHHTVDVTVIHRNQIFRASGYALGTAAANRRIHACQTVNDRNRLVFTYCFTVAVSETAVIALPVATVELCRSTTGRDAVIIQLAGREFLTAAATDHRRLMRNIAALNAEQPRRCFRNGHATGRA